MIMSLVPTSVLLAAGLLASPALGELAGLRGSLKANLAAEDDRAARRELQSQVDLPFSMLLEPTPPELPDIVPGRPIELPPGAVITQRTDFVARDVSSGFSERNEGTKVVKIYGSSAAQAGAEEVDVAAQDTAEFFFNDRNSTTRDAGEESTRDFYFDRINKNEYDIGEHKEEGKDFENRFRSETTYSQAFRDGNTGSGLFTNSKIDQGSTAEENTEETIIFDQNGPLAHYYYNDRMSDGYTDLETNVHEYEFEYSLSLP